MAADPEPAADQHVHAAEVVPVASAPPAAVLSPAAPLAAIEAKLRADLAPPRPGAEHPLDVLAGPGLGSVSPAAK